MLTVIMYHYVRHLARSRYPEIKGLSTEAFQEQVAYIKRHYNVISGQDLLGAVDANVELPPRAALLTFDDGYIDHFTEVFPILDREKLPGCFFAPAKCILDDQVLDVNKIHFVLASVENKQELVDYILKMIDVHRVTYGLKDKAFYLNKLEQGNEHRYDPKEVVFIKRMLQRELPEALRIILIDGLFDTYVTKDEAAFARELYMSIEQIMCMQRHGMYFGSHGYHHYWLNSIDAPAQEREIDLSMAFLEQIGTPLDQWIMCYPYGAYDASLLTLLKSRGCTVGLSTDPGIADIAKDNVLTLPRLDTNDLPKSADAQANEWTRKALDGSDATFAKR